MVSLEALILAFDIRCGFEKERIMFLNPESFSPKSLSK